MTSNGVALRQELSAAAARIRADFAFATIDVLVVVAAYTLGLALRMLDPLVSDPLSYWGDLFSWAMLAIVAIHLATNAMAGAYGHVWEHASMNEAVRVVAANAVATSLVLFGSVGARETLAVTIPVSAVVLGGFFSMLFMGLIRFRSRLFSLHRRGEGPRILMVGYGAEAATFGRRAAEVSGGRVVGFLADDRVDAASVRRLAGAPILGSIDQVGEVVVLHDVDEVIVIGKDPFRLRSVVDGCVDTDVHLRVLPLADEVLHEGESLVDPRDIRVEDLLSRDTVATDLTEVAALIKGKTVLVTGGGGSIGSEIVRQVSEFEPAALWAFDRDETLLHEGGLRWPESVRVVLGDVRDATATLRTFERIRPDIVFHAAALKHVPVLEANVEEAVLTNVLGTANVIQAGSRTGMQRFVLISTDKAVQPTSVMGATKRVAELLTKAGHERRDGCTYTAVRFGNVLGSRGSVIPTFVEQVKAGGPVTVTHPDMTRYFMTVDEAVQLVLQASAMASGSEVFLLDMGDPVRIDDLARRLIRLAGLIPGTDIEIRYTGIRPGEKLEEVLAHGPLHMTENPKVFEVPLEHPGAAVLFDAIGELDVAARAGDTFGVRRLLNDITEGTITGGIIDSQLSLTWP